jgi:hypothetical protein
MFSNGMIATCQLLEGIDRPALKPLPIEPYVFAEWRVRRVGIDYHVDVEGHFARLLRMSEGATTMQ